MSPVRLPFPMRKSIRSQGSEIIGTELIGEGVDVLLLPASHRGLRPVFKDDAGTIEIPECTAQGGGGIDVDGGVVQAYDRPICGELRSYQVNGGIKG